ncbi:MAG: hypothetical protein HZC49_00410 [Nitrospirae bacterium]|nr:hypothetical protein [Nitrospirota bacterium]
MRILGLFFMAMLFLTRPVSAGFVAYNDTAGSTGSASNVTYYNGFAGGTLSGFLMDYSTGSITSVNASLTALSAYYQTGNGSMPASGTDAYNIFNGIIDLSDIASYAPGGSNWSYEVTFTGLDPAKYYDFVTTANRDNSAYGGDGDTSRWTSFSITGADTFTNSSSSGVTVITPGVVQMNTGYNTVNGYVIGWTGISAADGSFTVRSENVGAAGPGDDYKSYGIQGFKLAEAGTVPVAPEPISSVLFIAGGAALGFRRLMKKTKN